MINEDSIDSLSKLSYIDKIKKIKGFSILIYYDKETKTKRVSRRVGPTGIITVLNAIKKEVGYKDETSETMPFYVA